jgi:hypothetical protein
MKNGGFNVRGGLAAIYTEHVLLMSMGDQTTVSSVSASVSNSVVIVSIYFLGFSFPDPSPRAQSYLQPSSSTIIRFESQL